MVVPAVFLTATPAEAVLLDRQPHLSRLTSVSNSDSYLLIADRHDGGRSDRRWQERDNDHWRRDQNGRDNDYWRRNRDDRDNNYWRRDRDSYRWKDRQRRTYRWRRERGGIGINTGGIGIIFGF